MNLRPYLGVFILGMKNQMAYWASLLLRNLMYVLFLFVFFSLWRVIIGPEKSIEGMSLLQTIWYLSFSEVMLMSTSSLFMEIQTEIKDGSVAYSLLRPYSYPAFRLFQAWGESVFRLGLLLLMGFVAALVMVGPLPGYSSALVPGLIGFVLAQAIILQLFLLTGLLAFWMEEVSPVFWIVQKGLFILGGAFLPLDFFPAGIRGILSQMPFAYAIYHPCRVFVEFTLRGMLEVFFGQLIWIGVLSGLIVLVFSRARKQVQAQGG